MIDLNPESVRSIISQVREFQTEASMTPDEAPESLADDQAFERLTEYHGDPRYTELRSLIEDLEPDQQRTLVALMWLGRGDYELDDWEDALAYAGEADSVSTVDYLIATPLLADFLEEGLNLHGYEED
jgi:hypothetical protein